MRLKSVGLMDGGIVSIRGNVAYIKKKNSNKENVAYKKKEEGVCVCVCEIFS